MKRKLIAVLEDYPGSLAKVLNALAKAQINISYIRSQAIVGHPGESAFFIEVEDNPGLKWLMAAELPFIANDIEEVQDWPAVMRVDNRGRINMTNIEPAQS